MPFCPANNREETVTPSGVDRRRGTTKPLNLRKCFCSPAGIYLGEAAAAGVDAPVANFTVAAIKSAPFGSA
jgi:hypothetical protein